MSGTGEAPDRVLPVVGGFTLLELLVIIGILALVSGILFPSLDRALQRQTFADTCARIELALRSARAAAIRGGVPVRVAASADRHRMAYAATVVLLPETSVVDLPEHRIAFFADGSAVGGEIRVADRGAVRRWAVHDATGTIERLQ